MQYRQIQTDQARNDDKTPSATGGHSIISCLFQQTSLIHDCKYCHLSKLMHYLLAINITSHIISLTCRNETLDDILR